jgi:DNA-binding NarL/FixJ family response regulator
VERGFILVVDADLLMRRAIARALSPVARVTAVGELAGPARALSEHTKCIGIILEAFARGGSGLDWLDAARQRGTQLPALVLTARCDPALVNRAYRLGARYLCKPFTPEDLRVFAVSATMNDVEPPSAPAGYGAITLAVSRLSLRHGLTSSEVAIVRSALNGVGRDDFLQAREISANTYKSQVRGLLRKVRATSVGEVRDRLLREAHPVR